MQGVMKDSKHQMVSCCQQMKNIRPGMGRTHSTKIMSCCQLMKSIRQEVGKTYGTNNSSWDLAVIHGHEKAAKRIQTKSFRSFNLRSCCTLPPSSAPSSSIPTPGSSRSIWSQSCSTSSRPSALLHMIRPSPTPCLQWTYWEQYKAPGKYQWFGPDVKDGTRYQMMGARYQWWSTSVVPRFTMCVW